MVAPIATLRGREGRVVEAAGKLQVLISDEHGIFRDALRAALEREPDLEVVGEAAGGPEAVTAAERLHPDVAILSATLATYGGVRASCLIRDCAPDCRTIVLADIQNQRQLSDGLDCGASAYLTKDASVEELVEAVRAVARGETLIPPVMLGPLLSELLERRDRHEQALLKIAELSPREREVLALVADGLKTSGIAEELVISPETARTHVQNVLGKLGVHSRLEAASFVIENGLISHIRVESPALLGASGRLDGRHLPVEKESQVGAH
jgi:DNA-binding NarL/FixJ family response regulator